MDWRETLAKSMAARGVSKGALSEAMGVGAPQITRLFHPESNPTVETLGRMANAAGLELVIGFEPARSDAAEGGRVTACEHGTIGSGCAVCGN